MKKVSARSRTKALEQSSEHSLYFHELDLNRMMFCGIKHSLIAGKQKEIFDLTGRPHRHMQELPEFGPSPSTATLCNIRWNRTCCPPKLAAEPKALFGWRLRRNLVNKQHETMAAFPNLQLAKVLHPSSLAHFLPTAAHYLKLITYNLILTIDNRQLRWMSC